MTLPRTDTDIKRDVIESLYWDTRADAADIGVLVEDGQVTSIGSVPTYRAGRPPATTRWSSMTSGGRTTGPRSRSRPARHAHRQGTPGHGGGCPRRRPGPRCHRHRRLRAGRLRTADGLGADRLGAWARTLRGRGAAPACGDWPTRWSCSLPSSTTTAESQAVASTLKRNRHVDLSTFDVEVVDDAVTLSGPVPDESVREEVLDAARHTHGVTDITDLLQVTGRPRDLTVHATTILSRGNREAILEDTDLVGDRKRRQ